MAIGELASMRKKVVSVSLLVISIIIAISIITIALYHWIPKTNNKNGKDCDENLLYSQYQSIDIHDIFSEKDEIQQVATRYSILHRDKNKRQMHVFSIPVRNYNDEESYSLINTDISKYTDDSYITQNSEYNIEYNKNFTQIGNTSESFRMYFPQSFEMTYDDSSESVRYSMYNNESITIQPGYNGMIIQYHISDYTYEISLPLGIKKYRINNDNAGYVVLSESNLNTNEIMNNNYFIVSAPLIYDMSKNANTDGRMQIFKEDGEYTLKCSLPSDITFPVDLYFTVNYYRENMFFDCAAYQKSPNDNHIFDSYIVYDNISEDDETYNYMKFNIRSFTPKDTTLLDRVLLNLNVLYCSNEIDIEVYSVRYDWCSWELTWNNRPLNNEKIGEFKVNETGWYSIDITEYVRSLIKENYFDLEDNSIMMKIKDKTKGKVICSSTDNCIFPPFFQVDYRIN